MNTLPKRNRHMVTWEVGSGLVGTVPNQISKLRRSLKHACPPARDHEMASYLHRREITELIGELHLYLSEF